MARATVTARGNESSAVLCPAQQSPVHLFPATTAWTTGRTLVARVVFAFLKFKMTGTTRLSDLIRFVTLLSSVCIILKKL